MSETYKVRINDGPVQDLATKTTQYQLAAAAALALLDFKERDDGLDIIEIWCPRLLAHGYGPYLYGRGEDKFGRLVVGTVIRRHPSTGPVTGDAA